MAARALICPSCGAPLPPEARRSVVVCPYCKATVTDDGPRVHAAEFRKMLAELELSPDGLPRIRVAGLPYRVLGRIAQGESTDVFLAERAHPLTERVILKLLRASSDADLMDREWDALTALAASDTQGAIEFATRLPSPVARGRVEGRDLRATLYRAPSGFVDTFEDILEAYPNGVDGVHGVWMWRRILELLGWVHRAGWVHGAIVPAHILTHARDHGVMLVGWSSARRLGERAGLSVYREKYRDLYPESLLRGEAPSAATDIAMSARCIARVLGGAWNRLPMSVPSALRDLIAACAEPSRLSSTDAWEIRSQLGATAHRVYGPPKFHPFLMPGWA